MKEFKINDHIIVRLEDKKTNIYVDGELFNQCKYILMRKTVDEMKDLLEDMDSVDDLEDHLDHSLDGVEPELIDIPAETRFWAHCSNMQVWAENNYDIRLIHSNLAFPLLKKLTEQKDKNAKKVLRNAIIEHFSKKRYRKIIYLLEQDYLNAEVFTYEEIKMLFYEFMENADLDNAENVELFLEICQLWACYKIKNIIPRIKQILKTLNFNKPELGNYLIDDRLGSNFFIDNRHINIKQWLKKIN